MNVFTIIIIIGLCLMVVYQLAKLIKGIIDKKKSKNENEEKEKGGEDN